MRAYETATALRVLLVVDDRRFRALAATLLSRRGYAVSVSTRNCDLAEVARREAADVVVLDASASLTTAAHAAARLAALEPPVAIVAVSTDDHPGLLALPVVSKWGPADVLFTAIEHACLRSARTAAIAAVSAVASRDTELDEVTHVA